MKFATVGVHVLDTHVIGVEGIPDGSEGQLVETIRFSPAGTAGGTAIVLSRLGAEVRSFGAVGEDPIATSLLGMLDREGVDVAGLVRKAGQQTSSSVIPVRPNGDRPAWHCIGANGAFTLDDLDLADLDGITHLHLGGPEFLGGEAAGKLLAHAKSIGATTSLDLLAPGDPDMLAWIADALPHTDYLLPNDEQVLGLTGASSLAEGVGRPHQAGRRLRRGHAGVEGRAGRQGGRDASRCRRTTSRSWTPRAAATPSRPASSAASRSAMSSAWPPRWVAPRQPRSRRGWAPTRATTRWRASRSSPPTRPR